MTEEIVPAYDRPEAIQKLFGEYTKLLISNDAHMGEYLKLQKYDTELEHLDEKYGPPSGRLYLLLSDGKEAGCAGLRKLDDAACELKRLYVVPEFRGHHFAEHLVTTLLGDARKIGYQRVLLDTMPFLRSAIHLYRKLGFYEIASYNNSPLEDTIFMRLDLHPESPGSRSEPAG
jgi:ribosomal protein S18 acetylase RimI-like enzyme